jgi:hypothetical protein
MGYLGVGFLGRDGEDTLRDTERRKVCRRHLIDERPDRHQARIACLDRVLPLLLKFVQKRENEIALQIRRRQCGRLAPVAFSGGRG